MTRVLSVEWWHVSALWEHLSVQGVTISTRVQNLCNCKDWKTKALVLAAPPIWQQVTLMYFQACTNKPSGHFLRHHSTRWALVKHVLLKVWFKETQLWTSAYCLQVTAASCACKQERALLQPLGGLFGNNYRVFNSDSELDGFSQLLQCHWARRVSAVTHFWTACLQHGVGKRPKERDCNLPHATN